METQLIGKSLSQAEEILKELNLDYVVRETKGGKDEEILQELYVVSAISAHNKIELIVTGFKTTI